MQFNSWAFFAFFVTVWTVYLLLKNHYRAQNVLLVFASFVFYTWVDWRLALILLFCILSNFLLGIGVAEAKSVKRRRILFALSLLISLSVLGFFKYFNFFAESTVDFLRLFGLNPGDVALKILLPIGISFYTFMGIGYVIDVYRGSLPPTKSLLNFALFMSFFPQIAAGPIGRAPSLLPQFAKPRRITAKKIDAGVFLIIWGYFQKMVVADNLGRLADQVFNGYTQYHGLDIVIGILAFTVQIYCDFSGYSDIARGIAKLMGFDLMVNFRLPYFALNPSDFWSRWHISLSSWIRDYIYVPLGGNRKGKVRTYGNLNVTMLLCGLWHGAAWNYVLWGAYHGVMLTVYRVFRRDGVPRETGASRFVRWRVLSQMALMFLIAAFGWLIFRSTSMDQFTYMISHLGIQLSDHTLSRGYDLLFFTCPLVLMSMYRYRTGNLLAVQNLNAWLRIFIYAFLIIGIIVFGVRESMQFIYSQF